MLSFIFELAANLFDGWLGTYFTLRLNGGKVSERPAAFFITVTACFAVSTAYLFISVFSLLHSVLIYGILLAFSFTCRTTHTATKLLGPTLFELTLIVISSALAGAISASFGTDLATLFSAAVSERYLLVIGTKLCTGMVLMLVLRTVSAKGRLRPIDLVLYLAAPFMSVSVLYTFMRMALGESPDSLMPLIVFSAVGLAGVNAVSLWLFATASENAAAAHELALLRREEALEGKRYAELQASHEKLRMLRHDFRQQIAAVRRLAASGDIRAVDELLDSVSAELEDKLPVHTGNRMMDYLIHAKAEENPQITFYISGQLEPIAAPDEAGQASLFGNMLENAVEASRAHGGERIDISFFVEGGYQNILCKNRVSAPVLPRNPRLQSGKGAEHGYGVKSMHRRVQEAAGMIDFYEEEGAFCVHIALPLGIKMAATGKNY